MLKAQVLAAVAAAKVAVQDLAITCNSVTRAPPVHVPGVAPVYVETLTAVSIVFTKFESKEIDESRVMASDWKGLVFQETGLVILTNGVIRVPAGLVNIASGDYRILNNDKIMAGDTVVLHQLHLRKL